MFKMKCDNLTNLVSNSPNIEIGKKIIYLDNAATTKVDEDVVEIISDTLLVDYGNPSSLHSLGVDSQELLENARLSIKKSINSDNGDNLIFTSGATEANNMVIFGVARAYKSDIKNKIIISKIEHSAISEPAKQLEKEGFEVVYIDVDRDGFIDFEQLESSIDNKTILVSIIHANHEVGTVQDIKRIGEICKENNVFFHTDGAQSYTKIAIDVKEQNIDLLSLNSHKIHGPKGAGALYMKKGIKISRLMYGGPQENNIRAGTENIPAILGFEKAVKNAFKDYDKNIAQMKFLQNYMIEELLKIDNTNINGSISERSPHNVNVSFDYIEGEALLMHLDLHGICISTGSACSSKSLEPSHVLIAMGRTHEQAHGSVRFSLSKYTTKEEIDFTIKKVREAVEVLRKLSPLTPKV